VNALTAHCGATALGMCCLVCHSNRMMALTAHSEAMVRDPLLLRTLLEKGEEGGQACLYALRTLPLPPAPAPALPRPCPCALTELQQQGEQR